MHQFDFQPNSATAKIRPVSMSEAARRLGLRPGGGPSRDTLKRDAAKGLLKHCEARVPGGSRTLYQLHDLFAMYPAETSHESVEHKTDSGSGAPSPQSNEVLEAAQQLIAPLAQRIEEMSKEVSALNRLRNTLMTKYDAAASLAHERYETTSAQLKQARSQIDLQDQIGRLAIAVSQIREIVLSLKTSP